MHIRVVFFYYARCPVARPHSLWKLRGPGLAALGRSVVMRTLDQATLEPWTEVRDRERR